MPAIKKEEKNIYTERFINRKRNGRNGMKHRAMNFANWLLAEAKKKKEYRTEKRIAIRK